jgi:hypothetical protein
VQRLAAGPRTPEELSTQLDDALIVRGVDVLRRGSDGVWRYVISLLQVCERSRGEQP